MWLEVIRSNIWVQKGILSILVSLLIWLVYISINKMIYQRVGDISKRFSATKMNRYIFIVIWLVVLSLIWLEIARNLSTFLGLFSAGLAIALRELFANMAAWVYLITVKPFVIGDRILINGQFGDVIDIRLFQFSLVQVSDMDRGQQSTGAFIDVPNHFIFSNPVLNETKIFPYVWQEMKLYLSMETDWKLAKQKFQAVLEDVTGHTEEEATHAMEKAQNNVAIHYRNLTPIVYLEINNGKIELSLRYLTSSRQARVTREKISEAILRVCEEESIDVLAVKLREGGFTRQT